MISLETTLQYNTPSAPWIENDMLKLLVHQLIMVKSDTNDMLQVLSDFFSKRSLYLSEFPFSRQSYSRSILYRDNSGFEIMMARWDKHSSTPIHGHPDFSLVYIVEGQLEETVYTRKGGNVVIDYSTIRSNGDFTYNHGVEGRFDNFIHKIKATTESLSLHIYSDDALKGEVFNGALN